MKRKLYPRIFPESLRKVIKYSATVSDREAEAMAAAVRDNSARLCATAIWHKACNRAYQRYYRAGGARFLGTEPIENLFVPAWNAAGDHPTLEGAELAARADEIVLALSDGSYVLARADMLLADPEVVAELTAALTEGWATRVQPEPTIGLDDLVGPTLAELDLLRGLNGPRRPDRADSAEREWQSLVGHTGVAGALSPFVAGLSRSTEQPRAELRGGGAPDSFGLLPFYPLDSSIRARLSRINASAKATLDLDARAALDALIAAAFEPYGLAHERTRATLVLGAVALSGITAELSSRIGSGSGGVVGVMGYFARRWRRDQTVRRLYERPGQIAEALLFVEDPYAYIVGRLWISLARDELTGSADYDVEAAWLALHGAFESARLQTIELSKRLRESEVLVESMPGLGGTDSEGRVERSIDGLAHPGGESWRDRAEQWVNPGALPAVLRFADDAHGVQAVESFVARIALSATDPEIWAEQRETWERWSTQLAWQRAEHLPRPALVRSAAERVDEELAMLPSYDQVVAHVARRAIAWHRRKHSRELWLTAYRAPALERDDYSVGSVLEHARGLDEAAAEAFAAAVRERGSSLTDEFAEQWGRWRGSLAEVYATTVGPADRTWHEDRMATIDDVRAWAGKEER